jgi:hypothetical protein
MVGEIKSVHPGEIIGISRQVGFVPILLKKAVLAAQRYQ